MMSLRSAAAGCASRALSRASTSIASQTRVASRSSSILRAQRAFLRPQQLSAFSTTVLRKTPAGETDEELSAKLQSEIELEENVKDSEPAPASIKDFIENGPFEIKDVPGKEEVVLTRTFGNEKITVTFSIADLQQYDPESAYDEDPALGDEALEGGRNAETEGLEEELENEQSVPVRLNVVIEKPGKGALNIEATAQDGNVVVENAFYYEDAKLARGETAETAHTARGVYPGPPFGSLDEDLQVLLERYLDERGVSQALALFVPDYMEVKEQKEYLTWLNNIKGFVDA